MKPAISHSDYLPLIKILKALNVTKTKEWDLYGIEHGYLKMLKDMERTLFLGGAFDNIKSGTAISSLIDLIEKTN